MVRKMTIAEVVSYVREKVPEVDAGELFLYLVEHTQPPYSDAQAVALTREVEAMLIKEGSI